MIRARNVKSNRINCSETENVGFAIYGKIRNANLETTDEDSIKYQATLSCDTGLLCSYFIYN